MHLQLFCTTLLAHALTTVSLQIIYVFMKFGSDVPFQMIKVYQTAIENFVKGRPREVSKKIVPSLITGCSLYL